MDQFGPYKVLKEIAKGGMGEVFLVHDPVCRRDLALKRMRTDLKNREVLYRRFLREARITAGLTHPSVIPIYTIHQEEDEISYTMPYIEGTTLKELLKAKEPIPSLLRVFHDVCQVIAYAHSQSVLHRDIKPENVMVGKYGEVYLLDWGLAKRIGEEGEETPVTEDESEMTTQAGKVFGTIAYMAPELALGHHATAGSEVYALGMMLYEILSLHRPCKRGNLAEFRKSMHKERWIEPSKLAPYRNVPRMLATIAHKCLEPRLSKRYQTVDELVSEVEYYLEGRSEWFQIESLDVKRKSDWEFHENIYLPDQMGFGRDWAGMMVSYDSFPSNTRVTLRLKIDEGGQGLGLLMSIPEASEREQLNSGYCLWLGTDESRLYRSSVEVSRDPSLKLEPGKWHDLRLEKVDNGLHFYLDGKHKLSYISHLPLPGTHVGLIYRDDKYAIEDLAVHVGSYSIRVNCLAIPDAFLAAKNYEKALSEYRRIAYTFPERDEGREARFRAGITLLEQAKMGDEACFEHALEEFGTLHATPGAPLEYLGKALVYKTQKNNEEEVKCFELAFRKYPHHPLRSLLEEEVIYRLHAVSTRDRTALYRFLLIVVQYMPEVFENAETQKIVTDLQKEWEPLPFPNEGRIPFGVRLAFWLNRPHTILELDESDDAKFAVLELGGHQLVSDYPLALAHTENIENAVKALKELDDRSRQYLIELALRTEQAPLVHELASENCELYRAWAYLLENKLQEAAEILDTYDPEEVVKEDTLLHVVYGCFLAATEGEELAMALFSAAADTTYPTCWELLGRHLTGKLPETQEFHWHQIQLYRQLTLYYHSLGQNEKEGHFAHLQ